MIAVGSTSPMLLLGLVGFVVCVAGVVAGLEWIASTYMHEDDQ